MEFDFCKLTCEKRIQDRMCPIFYTEIHSYYGIRRQQDMGRILYLRIQHICNAYDR